MGKLLHNNFDEVFKLIAVSKQKAYSQVNHMLISLYWEEGKYISDKTSKDNWGKGVVNELADFIKEKDATQKGFHQRNLWRMKQFYETYRDDEKLTPLVTQISWTNNLVILSGCKKLEERMFYIEESIANNYSKRELERQIATSSFERTLLADIKLSNKVKELSQEVNGVFKDSYVFDFLDISVSHKESELQRSLITSLKEFILELGKGFAFIGQEYRVSVGNEDFYIDLLFTHRYLQCLVAFELKIGKFKPSDMGQLEFYLEALDRDVKAPHENPSIGVLLCREKDDEVVEYALSRTMSPAIIADYETKLIPKTLLRQKLNELYEALEEKE